MALRRIFLAGCLAVVASAAIVVRPGIGQEAAPAGLATAPGSADLAWRDGDTAATFATRLRAAAGTGDCAADEVALAALGGSLKASVTGEAIAGKPFSLDWQASPRWAASQASPPPAWLVVSVDGPARFSGDGFYALTPGAIGPFGLPAGEGRSRALVALSAAGTPEAGAIGIVPLVAGPLEVTAEIAGVARGCGKDVAHPVMAATLDVAASADAAFFVRDPFSFEAPASVLASPDGATTTEVYEGRFRLVEAATGAVLADREGRAPNYSPTGRFLAAARGDGYDVLDTVDGTVVAFVEAGDIGWENADSFVVNGQAEYGAIDVRNTLLPGHQLGFGDVMLDCTACPGLSGRVSIDLENDFVLRVGGQGYILSRLTGARETLAGSIDVFDEEIMAEANGAVGDFVARQGAAVPLLVPEHWNFRGGIRLTALSADHAETGDAGFDAWLGGMKRGLVMAKEADRAPPPAPETLKVTGVGQWRGAASIARPKPRADAMLARLREFGIPFADPAAPAFVKDGPPDDEADQAIAARIAEAVPAAAKFFAPLDFGCLPEAGGEDAPKAYAFFDDAVELKAGERTLWLTLFSCKWTSGGAYEPNFYLFDSAAPDKVTRLGAANPAARSTGQCEADIAFCGFEARLYGGHDLLIWSAQSRAAMLYDVDAGKTLFQAFDLPRGELLREVRYAPGTGHVVQINTDGSFFVYDARDGDRVLEGRYVDDETIAWTPDLRFDASPEGANYVSLRFPGRRGQHTFQQFSRLIRKPGLVASVLARDYRDAPAIIATPPEIGGEIRAEAGRIAGTVTTRGAAELRVYQDGLRTDTIPVAGGGAPLQLDVPRVAGARWASLVAVDDKGLMSLPVGRDLSAAGDALPVVHVLAVGVDRYDAEALDDLSFAARDSRTMFDALAARDGKSIALGRRANLVDAEATPQAVLARAEEIVAAGKEGETLVFSFAGHGLTGTDGRFYMATGGTDLGAIDKTALSWDALAAVLVKAKGRVVVFLDACHSGVAGTGLLATNDQAADGMLQGIPSGLVVFSASKGREFSEEAANLGGGVFTNAVADVIARDRARYDLDGNGAIEVSELYAGVKRQVSEHTEGRQVPWLARNEMVGDFALF